jgi:hypothetical protein
MDEQDLSLRNLSDSQLLHPRDESVLPQLLKRDCDPFWLLRMRDVVLDRLAMPAHPMVVHVPRARLDRAGRRSGLVGEFERMAGGGGIGVGGGVVGG